MTTAIYKKLKRELKEELMQEFITPLLEDIKDAEGEYRAEFVQEVRKAAKEESIYKYTPKSFSRLIS